MDDNIVAMAEDSAGSNFPARHLCWRVVLACLSHAAHQQ